MRASRAYVPDGLSVAAYAQTKLREEDDKKALDLGAWGPRSGRVAALGAFDKAWLASFWMGGRPPSELSADQQMWRDAGAVDPKKLQQNRFGRGGAPKIDVGGKKEEKKFFGLF